MLWRLKRDYFEPDLELIGNVKHLDSVEDIRAEVSDARDHHPPTEFFRGALRVRISGKRLVGIASKLFAQSLARK